MQYLSLTDLLFGPIVFLLIYVIARMAVQKKRNTLPEYRYYLPALLAKLFGGLSLCLVYTLYYPGGDTIQYYLDGLCFVKLLIIDPAGFFQIFFKSHDITNIFFFSVETGYPAYFRDPETWFVVKITAIIVFFSMKSFVVATLLTASISFLGVWKLYKVFVMEFPELKKEIAISVFFIPSVFFWGSGLLKDTFTFSAIGFFIYGFYMLLIRGEKRLSNLILTLLAGWMIISIKPYILVGLLPGLIFWIIHKVISRIPGKFARFSAFPVLLIISVGFGYMLLKMLGDVLAEYSINNILQKAVTTQRDLKMDFYRGNSFDIGEFEATVPSMVRKAPAAIFAALFRPFILEANNIVMLLSSIENLILLGFTIQVLIKTKIIGFFRIISKHHFLTFSIIFSIFFAFSVGISTSNFGSLVRYKVPCIPFYVTSLFVIRHIRKKELEQKENIVQYSTLMHSIDNKRAAL